MTFGWGLWTRQDDIYEPTETTVARILAAIAHPARLQILGIVADGGDRGVRSGDIARRAGLGAGSASGHLTRLVTAGAVTAERNGKGVTYRPDRVALGAVLTALADELGVWHAWPLTAAAAPAGRMTAFLLPVGTRQDAGRGTRSRLLDYGLGDAVWNRPGEGAARQITLSSAMTLRKAA